MHKFYFNNEVLPPCENIHEFTQLFVNTLTEYKSLVDEEGLKIQKGIVTEKMPSEISFGGFSLEEVIQNIEDVIQKRIAYSYFIKYPIAEHFTIDREDEFLTQEYYTIIAETEKEALYLAYVADANGFLYSVPIHNDLAKDQLLIQSKTTKEELLVNNLFGTANNTIYVRGCIDLLNNEGLNTFERLTKEFGTPIYSNSFEREFGKLTLLEQKSIIDEIVKAKGRNLKTPLLPDTKIVKDVSPDNAKHQVCELRIYHPTAIRVYFCELNDKVYIASVEKKSNPNQSNDIKKAHNAIRRLILTDT